jgi:tetratricopeptide (TPR) repeat protein
MSAAWRLSGCLLTLLALTASDAAAQGRRTQRVPLRPAPVNPQEEVKKQADAAYRSGDYPRAIELAGQAIAANAADHVAYYLRGSARVELGVQQRDAKQIRDGIADAREAIRIEGRNNVDYYLPYLYGMLNLASIEETPAHAEAARDVATKLLAMSQPTPQKKANVAYQRAQIQLQLNDRAAAMADLVNATNYDPKHAAARLLRCDLLAQSGNLEDAEAAFKEAVTVLADQPMAFNNRGMFYQSLGRVPEAVADFDRAVQLDPQFAVGYTNRGFARLESGDPAGAIPDFTKSLEFSPGQVGTHSLRGTARLQLGDVKGAIEDYEAAVQFDPRSPPLHADVGFARFFAKQHDQALAAFDKAVELDAQAKFLDPWRVAALLLSDKQAQAEAAFADVLKKEPADRMWTDALVLLLLGTVTDSDVLGAISTGDATQAGNQKCEAFYFIGLRWELQGKPADAEAYYRQALETKARALSAYRGAQFAVNEFGSRAGGE